VGKTERAKFLTHEKNANVTVTDWTEAASARKKTSKSAWEVGRVDGLSEVKHICLTTNYSRTSFTQT